LDRQSNSKKRHKRKLTDERAINAFIDADARPGIWVPPIFSDISPLRFAKFVIGLLMIPFCWITIETFLSSFGHAAINGAFWKTTEFWFFTIGFLFWTALFFGIRFRWMVWLYVAGHELTHAFFVLLCRGNVKKVHISADGGHILTNRNNFLISLSPYFIPFFTVILITVWGITDFFVAEPFSQNAVRFLLAAIGFTWAFHLTFTVWMIAREQPDVDQNGRLFSSVLIVWMNMIIISGMLIVASPIELTQFSSAWIYNLQSLGERLVESVDEMIAVFRK